MAYDFLDTLASDGITAAQAANGAATLWEKYRVLDRLSHAFGPREEAFIAERDTFYMATINENDWPYVQHRGGPPGFLRVLDGHTLGFADYRGNRQYISLGNIATNDRVALILVDYPHRARLKILGHMAVHDLNAEPELATRLASPTYNGLAERGFTIRLTAFDWNCPQHIVPRFTQAEVAVAIRPLHDRIATLEDELAAIRASKPA